MKQIKKFSNLEKYNPLYSLIAIEILKGRIKNPVEDVRKGKVSRAGVLEILNNSYRCGYIRTEFRDAFQKKLLEIA